MPTSQAIVRPSLCRFQISTFPQNTPPSRKSLRNSLLSNQTRFSGCTPTVQRQLLFLHRHDASSQWHQGQHFPFHIRISRRRPSRQDRRSSVMLFKPISRPIPNRSSDQMLFSTLAWLKTRFLRYPDFSSFLRSMLTAFASLGRLRDGHQDRFDATNP